MSELAPHALLRPRIAVPFVLVALIWGSTWLVIKDQLGAGVPPAWSVAWRFGIAAAAMALLARWRGERLRLDRRGHGFALIIGLAHFCCNFLLIYEAERHVTSGLVAVMFGLLMLPNALLGWLALGSRITLRFLLGTAIALAGIALLLVQELRAAPPGGSVWLGAGLTGIAVLSVSIANVLQATPGVRNRAVVPLLANAMGYGAAANVLLALLLAGPPVLSPDPRYLAGLAYLAIIGSVATFPLYYNLIRTIGPGRAAYNGVLVPVVAMGLSTLFEGYRWSALAAGGALLALVGMVVALRSREAG